jgi:hypothetical protein
MCYKKDKSITRKGNNVRERRGGRNKAMEEEINERECFVLFCFVVKTTKMKMKQNKNDVVLKRQ